MKRTWNAPVLGEGMYPVKFTEPHLVDFTDNYPVKFEGDYPISDVNYGWERTTVSEWDYNYEKRKMKWANAETEDGSLYVWIPRYMYRHNNDSYSIKFSKGIIDDTSGGFKPHPAFTFGDKELTGFWVSKFQAAADDITQDYKNMQLVSKPFKMKLGYAESNISYEFMRAYNLNRTLNSHMMKCEEDLALGILFINAGFFDLLSYGSLLPQTGVGRFEDGLTEGIWKYGTYDGSFMSNTRNHFGVYDYDCFRKYFRREADMSVGMEVEEKYRGVPKRLAEEWDYITYRIVLAISPKN